MEILKDLFDEKIISIINLFLENPEKRFSLTEISNQTKVNVATTSRILAKLISKKFINAIVIGKIRVYKLEKNEKTRSLSNLLQKEKSPLEKFIQQITEHPRIKKIILESRDSKNAKLILVGDFLPTSKIEKIAEEIKNKYNFKITFVEISENQYAGLRNFKNYNMDKQIIWERRIEPSNQ